MGIAPMPVNTWPGERALPVPMFDSAKSQAVTAAIFVALTA
ncbi:hypothetical protein [Mycobacterium kansasii]|nr:hypothetical protein [Mycobacterium kansasii]